jgi:hypothetical protein
MISDTHPDAARFQRELLRRTSFADRFSLVGALTQAVVSLCRQGIRERHPDFDERAVSLHFVEMNYGKELADGLRHRLQREQAQT